MGNNGTVQSSKFDQRFKEHLSSIQRKPKKKKNQSNLYWNRYVSPIERIFQIILEFTIRADGITHQALVKKTLMDPKTVRNYTKSLLSQGRIHRDNLNYKATIDDEGAAKLKLSAGFMRFDAFGSFDLSSPNQEFDIKDNVDRILFHLTNQIGAFVIYGMIEALNPKNPYIENKKFGEKLSPYWFEYMICSDIEDPLNRFRKIILWTIYYHEIPKN